MKQYIKNLSRLAIPRLREPLYLYMAASKRAISNVLAREKDKKQHLVYYVSRALHDAEVRYQPLEKAMLALVSATRKLTPYF